MWQDWFKPTPMPVLSKKFLSEFMNACPEIWSAERTALALEALHSSGFLRLQLRGASMLPTLWPGDEVEIASCSPGDVKVGDVVLAFRDDRFFLHRLRAFSQNGDVITCGDAMPRPDPQFPAGAIIGEVVQVTREGKNVPMSRRLSPFRRAFGLLLCYSSPARRLALRLHQRRRAGIHIAESENKNSDSNRLDLRDLTSELCNPRSR